MSHKRPTYHTSFDALLSSGSLPLADTWQPTGSSVAKIARLGMQAYTIKTDLRRDFILHCQSQGLSNKNWDQLFIQYGEQRLGTQATTSDTPPQQANQLNQPPQLAAYSPSETVPASSNIMSDDWQPSNNMLEYIIAMVCPNKDYIQAQLISFSSHYHGKAHPNWDQQFKKWINQGWNVYQNKNNYKDKDDKDFVGKHTDNNWRDGL